MTHNLRLFRYALCVGALATILGPLASAFIHVPMLSQGEVWAMTCTVVGLVGGLLCVRLVPDRSQINANDASSARASVSAGGAPTHETTMTGRAGGSGLDMHPQPPRYNHLFTWRARWIITVERAKKLTGRADDPDTYDWKGAGK